MSLFAHHFDNIGVAQFARSVDEERTRQMEKWGDQRLPDGTHEIFRANADRARQVCDIAAAAGYVTWQQILIEEVCEAFTETDPTKLREELVQCAAVIAAWVYDIDRRDKK